MERLGDMLRTSFFETLLYEVQVEMAEYWEEDWTEFRLVVAQ